MPYVWKRKSARVIVTIGIVHNIAGDCFSVFYNFFTFMC